MPTGRVKHVTATTLTFTGAGDFDTDNAAGKNLHFGIREHAMVATVNGLSLSKLRAYGTTFFIFSDYARPAIRLLALMELPTIFIFTHDAMGDGEDGPTNQSVEHLASLRAIPGLVTLRPGDANEVLEAYRYIMQLRHQPAVLVLSRQPLPTLDRATPCCHDDINLETHQLGRKLGIPIELPLRISVLDGDILSFYVPQLPQSQPKSLGTAGLSSWIERR